MQRPYEYTILSLTQILLNGCLQFQSNNSIQRTTQNVNNLLQWFELFNKICMAEASVWEYAPELPALVTRVFLNRLHDIEIYNKLHLILLNIDNKFVLPEHSVMKLLIDYMSKLIFFDFLFD